MAARTTRGVLAAGGLVQVLLHRRVGQVVLGERGERGLDDAGRGLALERQDGLLHTGDADAVRILGDQALDDAGIEVLDLLGTGVEGDGLDDGVAGPVSYTHLT